MLKNITYIFTIFFLFFTAEVISQPSITWNKVYNRHQSELAKDICKAETGNYFITGHTQGFLYVMKINDYGDTLWTKGYPKYDDINDACVSSDDGGCVIAGYGYIVKINSLGNIEWDIDTLTSRLYDIIKTNDNGYIACGNTIFSGYIIKINSNGQAEWSNNYTSGYSRNYRNITIANNGGYLAVGSSKENASADTTKALITKINDTGGIIWEKKHLIQNRYGNISSIVSDDNGYTVIGETDDSLKIINIFANVFYSKIDNNGHQKRVCGVSKEKK